jgi:hypothetical protein
MLHFEELEVVPTSFDRRQVRDALEQTFGDHPSWRDKAVLLITELLSSRPSAAAAQERMTIRVFADPDTLRVEVHDGGQGSILRRIRQLPDASERGWNPHLMNRVADRWGLVSEEEGAWVWFELSQPIEGR